MQLKMDLDVAEITANIKGLDDQSVRVYVDPTKISKRADLRKFGGKKPVLTGLQSNATIMRNKIRIGGKRSTTPLTKIADILDKRKKNGGLFSQAMKHADNKELLTLLNGFIDRGRSSNDIKKMENAGRSIVRNQIIGKRLGNNTVKRYLQKGFNRFGMSTGTLFNNIKGSYKNGK
jgi:hypothetical protein